MAGIVTHVELLDLEPDPAHVLTALLGAHHLVERRRGPPVRNLDGWYGVDAETDERLVWIRDYQPIWVRRSDGSLKAVRYLADTPYRSSYLPAPGTCARKRQGIFRYYALPGRKPAGRWVRSETLPLLHENGNLVTTGTLTFVTDYLVEENSRTIDDRRLLRAGYRQRSERQVLELLARAIERPHKDVVVLPQMPFEGTGHVDLFLLALDRDTVLVPEILSEALEAAPDRRSRAAGRDAMAFLDEIAAVLQDRVPRVLRLPMLAPIATYDDEAGEWEYVFVSPANALLVPVGTVRAVLLPRIDLEDCGLSQRALDRRYRDEWQRLFASLGWSPLTVESTQLAFNQGLLRCASYPVPR